MMMSAGSAAEHRKNSSVEPRKLSHCGRRDSVKIDELIMPRELPKGNVLALLNTLYTSGFASVSPNQPMLTGRTMHTLYALSFIVYVSNCFCDWIHVYFTVTGYATSFPLDTYLVWAMVIIVVCGSMLTGLLLVLCMENAFAQRIDITPYRSGLFVILEAIWEWLQAFNNFRVVFLIMLLHDFPMTFVNYFYIASCRCAGPKVTPWPLLASAVSTSISLLWRFVMLYFSYRRMICASKKNKKKEVPGVARHPHAKEHLKELITTSNGGRLDEYDEFWPVRYSRMKFYGADVPPETPKKRQVRFDLSKNVIGKKRNPELEKAITAVKAIFKSIGCSLLTIFLYLGFMVVLCAPCLYHYTCRKNSFHNRHRFSRSIVRYMSHGYHYFIFYFSLILTTLLLSLNFTLISSVHLIGNNQLPPEVSQICIFIDTPTRSILASIEPGPIFGNPKRRAKFCKPLWENRNMGFGLTRRLAGAWQTRHIIANKQMLAVSTQIQFNSTIRRSPEMILYYDFGILEDLGSAEFGCRHRNESQWDFIFDSSPLQWPYFQGCSRAIQIREKSLLNCDKRQRNAPAGSRHRNDP